MPDILKSVAAAAFGAGVLAGAALAQDERSFDLEKFDRIDVSAGIKLKAEVGGAQSVIVRTKEGDFSDFEIKVRNGALYLSRDYNRLRWHSKKTAYEVVVTAPMLRGLDASSGSHARIVNVNAPRFTIDLSSGAHANIQGSCEDCSIDLSSGAHLKARDLACGTARIDVSSGAHGELAATSAVVADASSGGHVTVFGNPERVSIDKSSGGRIYVASSGHQANRD